MTRFRPDFIIKYDPSIDVMTRKVLIALFVKPLRYKKSPIVFVGGDSGSGKSYTALKIEETILDSIGLKLIDYLHDINIYTPFEYPNKIRRLLYDKILHKIRIVCFHEAREIIKAKSWAGFLAQAVADVNAESRAIKPLLTIIISQFIRDITTDMRYTLNYYCTAERPSGQHTRLRIQRLWKDDRDLEKPKLRKARLRGIIIYPNGHRRLWAPKFLEVGLPTKEVADAFDKADKEAKTTILHAKLSKLLKDMQAEMDVETDKIPTMVEFYVSHPESLELVGHYVRGKFKIKPDVMTMHDMTKEEAVAFGNQLTKALKQKGIIQSPGSTGDKEGIQAEAQASEAAGQDSDTDSHADISLPGSAAPIEQVKENDD